MAIYLSKLMITFSKPMKEETRRLHDFKFLIITTKLISPLNSSVYRLDRETLAQRQKAAISKVKLIYLT